MGYQTPIAWPRDRVIPQMTWAPPAGTRIISADDHVIEEPHLWEERLKGADKDRAPRYWRDETGFHMTVAGQSYDVAGLPDGFSEGRPGMSDVGERLKDMDAEGIDASIVFHGRAAGLIRVDDKEFFVRCIDAFNEWLSEWRMAAPDRLFPVAYLPTFFKPETTADYLQKVKDWGLKSIEIPTSPRGVRYNSGELDPMWAAIQESGLPLCFHIGAYIEFSGTGSLGANLNRNLQPFNALFGQLVFSGVLDRFPDLKIVFVEGGAGWAGASVMGADKVYRDYASVLRPRLAHPPSYYWRRNFWTTFMDDKVALELVDRIGADKIMWSVDYPHPESVLGESMAIMQDIFETVGEEKARLIVGENAAKVWGI
jgi:predicted TIM-barrel fold metal-dependent hydrolase